MNDIVIAFDLGGTNLRFAVVDEKGNILHRAKTPTPRDSDTSSVIDLIAAMADECRARSKGNNNVWQIAAAVPAIIDEPNGVLTKLPNLSCLDGVPLRKVLSERLGLPVVLLNDASAAALGEHWLGASRKCQNSICITIGTGIGGGLVINSNSYRGVDGTAGEIGHICIEPNGVRCGCGSNGCVEQYASATAIVRMANESGMKVATSKEVFEIAEAGDVRALEVFERMGRCLGIAVAGLVNVLNPEMIVLGGGVSAGWAFFIEPLRNEAGKRSFQLPWERVKIVPAELGDNAGILGAARSAFKAGS